MICMTVSASAMSYEQARQQALFLTDKMAYELNLTDDQYEAAYEVNLDYLMSVDNYNDLYGTYWAQRNTDLGYILLDWQYRAYLNASYFYRPLYWDAGFWHFGIYARYPRRDYFFFGRPHFFDVYHGGHSWHMNGGRSWYNGRSFGGPRPGGQPRIGMKDGFNRGDFGRGRSFGNMSRPGGQQQGSRSFGGQQQGTRSFGGGNNNMNRGGGSFGNGGRESSTRSTVGGNRSFGGQQQGTRSGSENRSGVFGGNRGGSFGGQTRGGGSSEGSRSFTPRSTGGGGASFGGNRGGSFGGGTRSGGGGFSGGSHGGGGGSFGGHR